MAKKTTVKAVALRYGEVGGAATTPLMGVLKGLTVGQDEPDATEIEAEFFDTPFDIFYDGKPVTLNFELANYDLSELPALFGGSTAQDVYEGAASAYTTEHSWQLEFGRGNFALYIYKGLTVGTIKKDEDGALNFAVTITALMHETTTGTGNEAVTTQHMYKIVGTQG
jgi:hypothetical protein